MHLLVTFWETLFVSLLGVAGVSGLLALASPRAFAVVARFGGKVVSFTPINTPVDKWVDIDGFVLRHSRYFGFLATTSVTYLALLSAYGPAEISKPFLIIIVGVSLGTCITALMEIKKQQQQLDNRLLEAHTDALTGLANRRSFDIDLARHLSQRQRQGTPLCLLTIDMDHFKTINDTAGHHGGDQILSQFSRLLSQTVPRTAVVARIGGDEFAVSLAGNDLTEATVVAEQLRSAVCGHDFTVEGELRRTTVSIGLAEALADDDATSLMKRSDSALYAAKEAGRNRSFRQRHPEPTPTELTSRQ
ncbi:MAG: GGDEF domain-containing protein [Planctomycetia bacterium]|nr:GGDEF domain-containing protein [Planctomycetia bacterium]